MIRHYSLVLAASSALFLGACASASSTPVAPTGTEISKHRRQLAYRCQSEAMWPTHQSSAYRTAGGIQRQRMNNHPNARTREMRSLCWQMARADGTGPDDRMPR